MSKLYTAQEIYRIVDAMITLYPQDRSELNFTNSFELLCAVVLSAQTTDKAVNKVTPDLFNAYPKAKAMSEASEESISAYIKTIGLYKNKAKYLKQLSSQLISKFNGEVPQTREELTSLSGVGRKTANVVLANAFDIPAFAVDTHVERICKRFQFVEKDASVLDVEKKMTKVLPPSLWRQSHHSILLFGRYQCVARKHEHQVCIERLKQVMEEAELLERLPKEC